MLTSAGISTTAAPPVATHDWVIRSRRRLSNSSENSVASTGSDWTRVSGAPSIQSLDTNGSILGGIVLDLHNAPLNDARNEAPATTSETQLTKTLGSLTIIAADLAAGANSGTPDDPKSTPKVSDFWYKYSGFDPNPRASFKHEFDRLCKHIGALSKKERKNLQQEALHSEIKHYYGAHLSRLDRWQELCAEVGIEKIPNSITQCQKVMKY